MASSAEPAAEAERATLAVAHLYHSLLTGLILATIVHRSKADAAELVFRLFRKKQQEQFLPGLDKLGLRGLPPAVACARYHALSNQLGGVKVGSFVESDSKAWIRYPPPRWIWSGTAIAGIPTAVSRAMLRGWHAHNGVSLGVPGLGFVCTKQTVDGQAGLEGYYIVEDRPLEVEERLRFRPEEQAPPFAVHSGDDLPEDQWPPLRRRKAYRNYAMDYVSTALQVVAELFGPVDGGALVGRTARMIAMSESDRIAELIPVPGSRPEIAVAERWRQLAAAQGDHVELEVAADTVRLRQSGWRLVRDRPLAPELVAAWSELGHGLAMATDPALHWHLLNAEHDGAWRLEWRLTRSAGAPGTRAPAPAPESSSSR